MKTKQRLALWIPTFGFAIYNLLQLDFLTAIVLWGLAICVELQNELALIERDRRLRAEDCTRGYIAMLIGGRRKQRRPARVIGINPRDGNEAA